jgi:hypothetical protein
MAIRWASSADKHFIPREDALYAIGHAVAQAQLDGRAGEVTIVYVGHPHEQTDRYLEVIVALTPPRDLAIFHVMHLSDVYRHLLGNEGETK